MTQIRVKHDPPAPLPSRVYHGDKQQALPLTHHEILSLIAPFTRRGLQADLAASDRAARKLVFKPITQAAEGEAEPALRATVVLEAEAPKKFRLVRNVTIEGGSSAPIDSAPASPANQSLVSTLTAEGADIDGLLDRVEGVPLRRQIKLYRGIPLARSYYLDAMPAASASEPAEEAASAPVIVEARAWVKGINLVAQADRRRGMPVDVKLTADPGEELRLPEDMLAVIGWRWRPLVHIVSYWRGTIKVARKEPKRTPEIESKLGRTVTHLARTLEKSPERFHHDHLRARWRVSFQRAIPMLIGIALLAATPAIRFLDMDNNSILRMLIFHAPPMMLVGFFLMREMPRLEIPPFPRPLLNRAWIVPMGEGNSRAPKRGSGKEAGARGRTVEVES
jgi:hypothetical protein